MSEVEKNISRLRIRKYFPNESEMFAYCKGGNYSTYFFKGKLYSMSNGNLMFVMAPCRLKQVPYFLRLYNNKAYRLKNVVETEEIAVAELVEMTKSESWLISTFTEPEPLEYESVIGA